MTVDRYDPLARPPNVYGNEAVGAPSSATEIGRLLYRVEQLEKRLSLVDRPGGAPIETAVWGTEEPTLTPSPVWRVRFGGFLYEFDLDLQAAASAGSTSVDLYFNGASIASASIASGSVQADPVTVTGVRTAQGDQLWVVTTAIGTGALGLSAQARIAG